MNFAIPVHHAFSYIVSHAGRAALVNILAEHTKLGPGLRNITELHLVQNGANMLAHSDGHSFVVFSIAGTYMQHWNAPSISLRGV